MNDQFACETCDHIDALEFAYPDGYNGEALQCTQCQTGAWHGLLTRRLFNPAQDIVINRPNGIGMS